MDSETLERRGRRFVKRNLPGKKPTQAAFGGVRYPCRWPKLRGALQSCGHFGVFEGEGLNRLRQEVSVLRGFWGVLSKKKRLLEHGSKRLKPPAPSRTA